MNQLFRTKSIQDLIAAAEEPDKKLVRSLGWVSLMALGIGAVIGSGIFVLTGTAAAGEVLKNPSVMKATVVELIQHGSISFESLGRPGAGPGVSLSFLLTAIACGFAALCYAEMSSLIPVAGSAYTYAYATLGELVAWMIGWNLVLEYAVSNMAVAVGFSGYLNDLLENSFGWHLPQAIAGPMIKGGEMTGSVFNLSALVVLLLLTWGLVRGIKESARANNILVVIKLAVILLFIFGAGWSIDPQRWNPFLPNGASGLLTGAAIVFFTYIGFDSVSTAAEECRNPQRDMPRGIIATLLVCATLYIGVALVLTGIKDWRTLNQAEAPVADALKSLGFNRIRWFVSFGALMGMLSSLLVFQYGQARVWFAMSRDGLLPRFFSRIHSRYRTPHVATWIAGFAVGIPAGIWDIGTFADLSNIGTLFAFLVVSLGVLVLRRTQPQMKRGFRVPFGPLLPLLSVASCLLLMMALTVETWLRFFGWSAVGMVIYFVFGKRNSTLAEGRAATH